MDDDGLQDEGRHDEGVNPKSLTTEIQRVRRQQQREKAQEKKPERKTLLPPLWQRFQEQITGQDNGKPLPSSGAHVTLHDLVSKANEELQGAELVKFDGTFVPPLPPGTKVAGWIGTPDPRKYAPGTTYLDTSELAEEVAAGNVIVADDWQAVLQQLEPWQFKMIYDQTLEDLQKDLYVDLNDGQGSKVCVYDLYNYVANNPEMAEMMRRRRAVPVAGADGEAGAPEDTPDWLRPFVGAPDNENEMQLTHRQHMSLSHALMGTGMMWRRRPTRWLWGVDGVADYHVGMYVDEQAAQAVLGPKYAGVGRTKVLRDCHEEYLKDVMAAGPRMGMTFALAAARELPLKEAVDCWADRLSAELRARGVEPSSSAHNGLEQLRSMLDGKALAASKLLNSAGTHVRPGSTLFMTMDDEGGVLVQAHTPDPIRDREYYILGAALDPSGQLQQGMASVFLDPSNPRLVDTELAQQAASALLQPINGHFDGDEVMDERQRAPEMIGDMRPGMFRLPRVGAQAALAWPPPRQRPQGGPMSPWGALAPPDPEEEEPVAALMQPATRFGSGAPVYVRGVRSAVLLSAIKRVADSAVQAADAAEAQLLQQKQQQQQQDEEGVPEVPREQVLPVRRAAAQAAVQQGLSSLGLNVQGLFSTEATSQGAPGAGIRGSRLPGARELFGEATPLLDTALEAVMEGRL